MKKFLYIGAAVSIMILVIFFVINPKKKNLFRLNFELSEGKVGNFYTEKEISERELIMEDIPEAQTFKFNGKIVLTLTPSKRGKFGIFFTFFVKNPDGKKIETRIVLKRSGASLIKKRYVGDSYYHSFSKEINLRMRDRIEVQLKGEGIVALNTPVVYKIGKKKDREYVFVIALDTLRSDRVGMVRNGINLTPNISLLKKDSVTFSNAFAQSNWTLASFMSLFTSQYEFNHRTTKESGVAEDVRVLTNILRKRFFTFNLNSGLWMKGKYGFSEGFDFFNVYSQPQDNMGGEKLFKKSMAFLSNTNIPSLYMFLHTYQIHSPYNPPIRFLKKLNPEYKFKNLDTFFYKKQFKSDVSDEKKKAMEQLYDSEILAFDHFFGKFIDYLKEKNIYRKSMIIFLSDHGEEFYEHRGWSHGHSLYNDVIKIPLFIKFPGNKNKGVTVSQNAGLIDVYPTLFKYYGLDIDSKVDGVDLTPSIKGKGLKRELLFSSNSITRLVKDIPPKFTVIDGKYKLIYNYEYSENNMKFFSGFGLPPKEPEVSIFDISKDPSELKPLKGDIYNKLFFRFKKIIDSMKKIVKINSSRKSGKKLTLSAEEKKKLESLGYFQK